MMHTKAMYILGLLVLTLSWEASSEIQCYDAITRLMPCQGFLMGTSSGITVPCCEGVASLSSAAGSDRAELKSLCTCLKQTAASMGVNPDRAKQLPQLCNVTVPVPIDPNVNCDSL